MINKKDALTDVVQTLKPTQQINNSQPSQTTQQSQTLKPFQVTNSSGQIIQLGQNNSLTK